MDSMGLAAPRRKKKYDIDPRNNAWANDDNKFGQKLMEKFGWEKGKGLGANEDGETQNIKVQVKNDKHGIGANNDYSDTWLDHQDDFNSILASLNTCHSAPGSGTATPTNEESEDVVSGSMEERSKSSKSRVHYKKYTQGKDLTRAGASDLDALFGRRKKFEKRSKNANKSGGADVQAETDSLFAGMTPLGTTPEGGSSPKTGSEAPKSTESGGVKEYDCDGNLRTVTSSLSVSDYFAKKMADIKAKRNGVSTVVDRFCENSCNQFKENQKKMEEEKGLNEGVDEEKEEEVAEDKPEVYAQEKFQKASLTVQQYFELKMKEKKAKAAAQAPAQDVSASGTVTSESTTSFTPDAASSEKKTKKKKKKEITPSDVENNNVQTTENVEKKKKKKKKDKESADSQPCQDGGSIDCQSTDANPNDDVGTKKKNKKRKPEDRECEIGDIVGKVTTTEPPKKKKKKNKDSTSASAIAETAVTETASTPVEAPAELSDVSSTDNIKKKKKKKAAESLSEPTKNVEVLIQPSTTDGFKKEKKKKKKKKEAS